MVFQISEQSASFSANLPPVTMYTFVPTEDSSMRASAASLSQLSIPQDQVSDSLMRASAASLPQQSIPQDQVSGDL
jgi:hypothetical protein